MLARKAQLERAKAHLKRIETVWRGPVFRAKGGAPSRQAPLSLAEGALHEIRIEDWRDRPAALSFALALAGIRARQKKGAIVFLQLAHETRETGMPFARGFSLLGVDPGNVVVAFARDEKQFVWALEEAARERSVAAVVAGAPGEGRLLDLTATRRLSLAAEVSGASPIVLRRTARPFPTAAFIRWRIEAAPSMGETDDEKAPGAPRWRVFLERYRADGRFCGGAPFITELSHDGHDIRLAEIAIPLPPSPFLGDGPPQTRRPIALERRARSL